MSRPVLASNLHWVKVMERRASDSERPTVPCPSEEREEREAGSDDVEPVTRRIPSHAPNSPNCDVGVHREALRESSRVLSGRDVAGERRTFFRVRTALDVSIEAESHVFTATSVNLSPGGLLVSTYRALPRGLVISVEFDLPASRVMAEAVVSWSCEAREGRLPGYGIAFTDLSRFDRTLIESFCARLAPEAYPRLGVARDGRDSGALDRRLAG
jgi:uncharacterized protein (TIGR02266 family)